MHSTYVKPQPIRADYVLVIERLAPKDPKTGSQLVSRWNEAHPDHAMTLQVCSRSSQIIDAIHQAAADIPAKGIPLIHIEAHGSRWMAESGNLLLGVEGDVLQWGDLWDALREVNLKSNFNLMVFAATCFGAEAQRGIIQDALAGQDIRPLSFMATTGFDGKIFPEPLLASERIFYEALLLDGAELEAATLKANEILSVDTKLIPMWSLKALDDAISKFFTSSEENDARYLELFRQNSNPNGISERQFLSDIKSFEQKSVEKILSDFLSLETFPENKRRFLPA